MLQYQMLETPSYIITSFTWINEVQQIFIYVFWNFKARMYFSRYLFHFTVVVL